MGKFLIFYILYRVTGSPITALLILLAVYLAVDRAYLGFLPDPLRAFRASSRIRELKKIVSINPHDGRSLKELGIHYKSSLPLLEEFEKIHSSSSRGLYRMGVVKLKLGSKDEGVEYLRKSINGIS